MMSNEGTKPQPSFDPAKASLSGDLPATGLITGLMGVGKSATMMLLVQRAAQAGTSRMFFDPSADPQTEGR